MQKFRAWHTIARRNLLDAGGGEEGDRNGGEERRDQEGEDQGGAGGRRLERWFKPESSDIETRSAFRYGNRRFCIKPNRVFGKCKME